MPGIVKRFWLFGGGATRSQCGDERRAQDDKSVSQIRTSGFVAASSAGLSLWHRRHIESVRLNFACEVPQHAPSLARFSAGRGREIATNPTANTQKSFTSRKPLFRRWSLVLHIFCCDAV